MTSRDRDKYRKYKSGYDKKILKENKDRFLKSQQGSFERFLKNNEVTI
jgi:hypothetical protein